MAIPTYDWIAHDASTRGNCVAMEDLATGRELHLRRVRSACWPSGRWVCARGLGVGRGDRVAVLAHNSSDLFEVAVRLRAHWRGLRADANWRLTVPELRYIVGDC